MYCQRCGNEVPDGSSFCGTCGSDLGATTPLAAIRELANQKEIDLVRQALRGDYEVLTELGRGGMAIVYHAREIMLDREVALKVLPFSLAFDEEFVERFQREARTSARLEHPHIIPVYRVGKTDNVIYFSMKFLKGTSLADMIEAKGKLHPSEIRTLLIESASALGYAHSHDIVHRDIKPDNVMFKENGQAVVCDFGIAKAASGTKLTGTGMAIGTPYYMSPEQARAQPLDGRSDLYSLGVLAYQCLTGAVPFDGEDSFSIGYKHIMEELPEPQLHTGEERALFEVIRKMMAKDPAHRFQKAEDLVMVLSDGGPTAQAIPVLSRGPAKDSPAAARTGPAAARTTPLSAVPGLDEVPTGAAPVSTAPQPTPRTPMPRESMELGAARRRKKKSKVPALVAALVLVVGGGGGGAYYYMQVLDKPAPGVSAATPEEPATPGTTVPADSGTTLATAGVTNTPADSNPGPAEEQPAVIVSPPDPPVPTQGGLSVVGLAADANLFVNNTQMNNPDMRLDPGSYNLRVERPGYQNYTARVQIVVGETHEERISMRRTPPVVAAPPANNPPPRREPAPPPSQCAQFNRDTYNADGSCFTSRPRLPPDAVPFVTIDATVPSMPTGPVQLAIQVMQDGSPGIVSLLDPSDVPAFAVLAINYARSLTYIAALKDGQQVMSWLQQAFYPQQP